MKILTRDWYTYHDKDCGTKYRGCSPQCPKDIYEKPRKWIGVDRLDTNWISTDETRNLPKHNQRCLIAILIKPFNARWTYRVYDAYYIDIKLFMVNDRAFDFPDYWAKFPDSPTLTPAQHAQSEICHGEEKAKRIQKLYDQIKEIEEDDQCLKIQYIRNSTYKEKLL